MERPSISFFLRAQTPIVRRSSRTRAETEGERRSRYVRSPAATSCARLQEQRAASSRRITCSIAERDGDCVDVRRCGRSSEREEDAEATTARTSGAAARAFHLLFLEIVSSFGGDLLFGGDHLLFGGISALRRRASALRRRSSPLRTRRSALPTRASPRREDVASPEENEFFSRSTRVTSGAPPRCARREGLGRARRHDPGVVDELLAAESDGAHRAAEAVAQCSVELFRLELFVPSRAHAPLRSSLELLTTRSARGRSDGRGSSSLLPWSHGEESAATRDARTEDQHLRERR